MSVAHAFNICMKSVCYYTYDDKIIVTESKRRKATGIMAALFWLDSQMSLGPLLVEVIFISFTFSLLVAICKLIFFLTYTVAAKEVKGLGRHIVHPGYDV